MKMQCFSILPIHNQQKAAGDLSRGDGIYVQPAEALQHLQKCCHRQLEGPMLNKISLCMVAVSFCGVGIILLH